MATCCFPTVSCLAGRFENRDGDHARSRTDDVGDGHVVRRIASATFLNSTELAMADAVMLPHGPDSLTSGQSAKHPRSV